jgi:hypothetical protein
MGPWTQVASCLDTRRLRGATRHEDGSALMALISSRPGRAVSRDEGTLYPYS